MSKRFFHLVWRFNALAIAAVGAMGLFVGAYFSIHIARDVFFTPYNARGIARLETPAAPGSAPRPAPPTAHALSNFYRIQGTSVLWAALDGVQTYDFSYSSKQASSTRNVIFYDVSTGQSRRLLPDDTKLILDRRELRPADAPQSDPPRALLYVLAEADTDNDGMLTHRDQLTLALSRPNGDELTRLSPAVRQLKGDTLSAHSNTLVVMIDTDGMLRALHIDLATFKITKNVEVAP